MIRQAVCVGMYALVLLVPTVCTWGKPGKARHGTFFTFFISAHSYSTDIDRYALCCAQARLGRLSGAVLVGTYALVVGAYALFGQMAREDLSERV